MCFLAQTISPSGSLMGSSHYWAVYNHFRTGWGTILTHTSMTIKSGDRENESCTESQSFHTQGDTSPFLTFYELKLVTWWFLILRVPVPERKRRYLENCSNNCPNPVFTHQLVHSPTHNYTHPLFKSAT